MHSAPETRHFAAPAPGRGSVRGRTEEGTGCLGCAPETFARRSRSLSPRRDGRRCGAEGGKAGAAGGHVAGAHVSDWLGAPGPRPEGRAPAPRLRRGWPGGRVLRRPWVRSLWASCQTGRGRGRCFVGVRWLDTLIVLSPVSCGTVSVVPRRRAEQLYGIGRYRECSRAPEALGQEGSHPRGVPCRGAWGRLLPP